MLHRDAYLLSVDTDSQKIYLGQLEDEADAVDSEAAGVATLAIPITTTSRFCRVVLAFPDLSPCAP